MMLKILIVTAVLLAVLVIVVVLRPSEYHVSRSVSINRPPSAVFPELNDLHRYAVWSPFGKLDPAMKVSFAGPPVGPGATMAWSGNSQVGTGTLTIEQSRPGETVLFRLDFGKPFPSTASAEFSLMPAGTQTVVTWSLSGRHSFVPKTIGLFFDMNKMIGEQFDKGLADLKSIVESAPEFATAADLKNAQIAP